MPLLREALVADIPQMMVVRLAVRENRLSNPALVPYSAYVEYLTERGKGWVYEVNGQIIGFAIIDLWDNSIWALFVDPEAENQGVGRQLHDQMLAWYFTQTQETVWLGTAPNTRAATFYRKSGWIDVGMHGKNEIKFEMPHAAWLQRQSGSPFH
jgi:GNAT superfamily N-acetyltransferase